MYYTDHVLLSYSDTRRELIENKPPNEATARKSILFMSAALVERKEPEHRPNYLLAEGHVAKQSTVWKHFGCDVLERT